MLSGEPLDLRHRPLIEGRLKALALPISEYSFPNLYLFRRAHDYRVVRTGDEVFISGLSYDGHRYLMPTRAIVAADIPLVTSLLKEADFLFPIPDDWLPVFDPAGFAISDDESEADYVYSVHKFALYPGRNLHRKRNLLRQFTESYSHEALPLTRDRIADARAVLDAWQAESGRKSGETDYEACREALDRYEELALCGGIYYAEGEPAGFVLGEELGERTFVLHFAKALTKFKGIYQYVFSTFAKILPPRYEFLNLEQDLGNPALRQAKSSYQPDFLLRKNRVALL
jgi:hypothetical protein